MLSKILQYAFSHLWSIKYLIAFTWMTLFCDLNWETIVGCGLFFFFPEDDWFLEPEVFPFSSTRTCLSSFHRFKLTFISLKVSLKCRCLSTLQKRPQMTQGCRHHLLKLRSLLPLTIVSPSGWWWERACSTATYTVLLCGWRKKSAWLSIQHEIQIFLQLLF